LNEDEQFAAMHFTAFNGNLEALQLLERFGGHLDLSNNQGLNSLHFASQGNHPNVIHYLLNSSKIREMKDLNGCSPLHWACVSGAYQSVRYLLAEGFDPNEKSTSDECTPLHLAIKYMDETREVRTIHKLLIYGATVDS